MTDSSNENCGKQTASDKVSEAESDFEDGMAIEPGEERNPPERDVNPPNRKLTISTLLTDAELDLQAAKSRLDSMDMISFSLMADYVSRGMTGTQAMDYIAVKRLGYGYKAWSDKTGDRTRQSVYTNVKRAEKALKDGEKEN